MVLCYGSPNKEIVEVDKKNINIYVDRWAKFMKTIHNKEI